MALWTPANLTTVTLEGWYRVHDPAAILADGSDLTIVSSVVNAWADQSGHTRTLSKDTGSPGYDANGLSTGHPAVTCGFCGFRTAAGMGYPSSAVVGMMLIGTVNNATGRVISLNASGQTDSGASGLILYQTSGNINYFQNGVKASQPLTPSTTPVIVEGVPLSTTTADAGVNAVLSGTPGATVGITFDRMGLFAVSDSGGSDCSGSCAESILWAGVISSGERQQLEGYIAWNNGQQALLPGGHPYASAAPTTGGSPSGTLAATEAADAAAFTGTVSVSGTLAATEAQDVAAFTGVGTVSGTLAATEAPDAAAFAGAVADQGALAATETPDTAAFAGAFSDQGSFAVTEAPDLAAFTTSYIIFGSLAATEAPDRAAFTDGSSTGSTGVEVFGKPFFANVGRLMG